jgi:TPP-dependent pyruvate/acetoin dehydrogenase alpha subunit
VNDIHHRHIKLALTIRLVEEKFLQLFSEGKLNGTVHTCVGQEFSALAFAAASSAAAEDETEKPATESHVKK